MARPRPSRARRAALAAAATLAALAAGEAALRVASPGQRGTRVAVSKIPGLVLENEPGTVSESAMQLRPARPGETTRSTMGAGVYAINSWGFRGAEFQEPELADKEVVLFVGDSTTFGVLVDERLTFPRRLEASLRKKHPRAFVVNAGVPGYNAWDEAVYLEHLLARLKPKAVVLGLFMNDNARRGRWDKLWLSLGSRSLLAERLLRLRDHLWNYLPGRTEDAYAGLDESSRASLRDYGRAIGVPRYVEKAVRAMNDLPAWDGALEQVARMKAASDRAGARFICALLPATIHSHPGYAHPEPQAHIRARLEQLGISYIDLRAPFAMAAQRRIPVYFSMYDFAHFNENGHHLVADNLAGPLDKILSAR